MESSVQPVAVVFCPDSRLHDPGGRHPESVARYDAVLNGIRVHLPKERVRFVPCGAGTEQDVRLCHTAEYIEVVRRDVGDGIGALSTGDTDVCALSMVAALGAVGAVREGIDQVMRAAAPAAFCVTRPPGHHAGADCGRGFCIFNNIAIGARHVQRRHGVERVLIVDWDAHHGNGTQELFYDDPSVFYFSTHQWMSYPGTGAVFETGAGAGRGFTRNCPLGIGCGGREVLAAMREHLVPAMRRFRPQFVLVSAGFDAHAADPLAALTLDEADFAAMTRLAGDLAAEYAGGRLVSVLEGGYELTALADSVAAHVGSLCREAAPGAVA